MDAVSEQKWDHPNMTKHVGGSMCFVENPTASAWSVDSENQARRNWGSICANPWEMRPKLWPNTTSYIQVKNGIATNRDFFPKKDLAPIEK